MGLLTWLGLTNAADLTNGTTQGSTSTSLASPYAGENHLAPIIAEDLWGLTVAPVTRAEAMSVPAVAKARHLICETLARQPLKVYRDGVPIPDQPSFLTRTDSDVDPRLRMLWTLDDLLFHGWSLWGLERGAAGQILDAVRIPYGRWCFDSKGRVEVSDENNKFAAPDGDKVLLIPGPGEGLIGMASRTIRAFRDLENAWQSRVSVPLPATEIRYTGDEVLEEHEMADIRAKYVEARKDPMGAVVVLPSGFEIHSHSMDGFDLFEVGRNSATLDIARFVNLPAAMLDASNVNASSVNYANNAVKRNEFHDITLRSWALPIEERLSQDDAVPRGSYVAFDLSALIEMPDTGIGPVLED